MSIDSRLYYATEVNNEKFYRLPQILFTHPKYKKLSTDAKVLYSILRDRQELSVKNGLVDGKGRVYSNFKIVKLMEILGSCSRSIVVWKKELVKYGLIVDKRMGLQKCNRIYVLKVETETTLEEDLKNIENNLMDLEEKEITEDFEDFETEFIEYRQEKNLNIYDNVKIKNVEKSINQSKKEEKKENKKIQPMKNNINLKEIYNIYNQVLKNNFNYEFLEKMIEDKKFTKYELEEIDYIIEIMLDVLCSDNEFIKIGSRSYYKEKISNVFLKLRFEHIQYVLKSYRSLTTKVVNPKNYLLTCLYNSYSTYEFSLQNDIKTDLFKVEEKRERTEENNENFMNLLEKY